MQFTHDTELALQTAAALVNTVLDGTDTLADQAGMDEFLRHNPMSGALRGTAQELAEVRALRERLAPLWGGGGRSATAAVVNELLREADAQPSITKHDAYDWHLHMTSQDAPLAHRMGSEAAMGFFELIRSDDLDRLKRCAADDCEAVLVDLSRNKSKRFCDTGNCANRAHVAAYRARQRSAGSDKMEP